MLMLRLDAVTRCKVVPNSFHYDTYDERNNSVSFRDYVESQSAGTVVLVATTDEPTGKDKGTKPLNITPFIQRLVRELISS